MLPPPGHPPRRGRRTFVQGHRASHGAQPGTPAKPKLTPQLKKKKKSNKSLNYAGKKRELNSSSLFSAGTGDSRQPDRAEEQARKGALVTFVL